MRARFHEATAFQGRCSRPGYVTRMACVKRFTVCHKQRHLVYDHLRGKFVYPVTLEPQGLQ